MGYAIPGPLAVSLSALSLPMTYTVTQPINGQIQVMMSDGYLVGSPANIADLHGATPESYTGSTIGYAGTYTGAWILNFVAVPAPGFTFANWTANGINVGTGSLTNVLMGTTAPVTIGALFTQIPTGGGSSGSGSSGSNSSALNYAVLLNWLTLLGAVMAGYGWWKK